MKMGDSSPTTDSSSDSELSSGPDDNETGLKGDGRLKLRKYQLELAENALLGKNTIICAGTGCGKTLVAMHIIQSHLDGAPKGTRKVVFMARTGALIKQQSEKLKEQLNQYQTRLISGAEDRDRRTSINMLVEFYDILCFTPQILVNSLEDKTVESFSQFSMLILDECHNTRGDEPYSVLMRKYLVEKYNGNKKLPQIIGLTASVGVGDSRTISEAKEHILRLCACLDVTKISTVKKNERSYKKHIQEAKEETLHLKKLNPDPCGEILLSEMEKTEYMLEGKALMQRDMVDLISEKHPRDKESQEYNKWTVEVMKASQLNVDDYNISRDIISCAKYLNIYNSALEVRKLLRTKDIIKFLAEKHQQEGEHQDKLSDIEKELYNNLIDVQRKLNRKEIKDIENQNVRLVGDTLKKMIENKIGEGEDSRAMVFVKARATCRSLAAFLDDDLKSIDAKASPLYGKESRAGDEGMTESVQTDILDKFRAGFYKVLVCTSVGNEGIDVPDCNIVLSYEYSGDEITKIQMKDEATTQTEQCDRESDKAASAEQLHAVTKEIAMQTKTTNRKRHLDSPENCLHTEDQSIVKEETFTKPEQNASRMLTPDEENNTALNKTGASDDSLGKSPEKRRKSCGEEDNHEKQHEGSVPCTSSLSSTGSCGYPFKKDQDDTLSESMVKSLSKQMESVGLLIASRQPVGTVFRVGSKYVMTAEHVAACIVDDAYVCFEESTCALWTPFRLKRAVYRSKELDVAVLELSESESPIPPRMFLSKDDAVNTLQLEDVSFIGYGHPADPNKHLDPRCKLVSPNSERLKDAHNWLEENKDYFQGLLRQCGHDPNIVSKGYAGYDDGSKLLFDSFMQKGASGSPALTINSPGTVKVVGILTHGLPEFSYLIQTNVHNICRLEAGSKMSSIYEAIVKYDKYLANDLFE